jgi:DNA (cytosine-5)-methyltransferase 1
LVKGEHPELIEPVRDMLTAWGGPFVIENVPGAPLRKDLILCGSMFDLAVRRHRWFECENFGGPMFLTPTCDHSRPVAGVYGSPHGKQGAWPGMLPGSLSSWSEAMGIDWMNVKELSQAVPPAYSEYIARELV